MQPSGRAEDMQALLVDLRPAPDSVVGGRRSSSEPPPAGPPLTANAMLGRFVGVPLQGPMLARIMPPGGQSAAVTGLQAGGQSSSIQVQPGGANVVRLSLSNKVFLKDHRKEKKKKKRPPAMEPMLLQPPVQAAASTLALGPPAAVAGAAGAGVAGGAAGGSGGGSGGGYGVAAGGATMVETHMVESGVAETYVAASGEPMTAVAEGRPAEEEEPEEEPTNIWLWIVVFLLIATVVTLAVLLLLKPEFLDALLPANENTKVGLAGRAVVTEALVTDA